MPSLSDTTSWVRALHKDQRDKAGQPYIGHVLRVHAGLLRADPDAGADVQHAALLHDVIEDCAITPDDLRARGYSQATIRMVQAVTKVPGDGLSYGERIDRLARSGPTGALQIKIADLRDNSDPARLAALEHATAASLSRRYAKALTRLQGELDRRRAPVDLRLDARTGDIIRRAFGFVAQNPQYIDWAAMVTPPRAALFALAHRLDALAPTGGTLTLEREAFEDFQSFLAHIATILPRPHWQDERLALEELANTYDSA